MGDKSSPNYVYRYTHTILKETNETTFSCNVQAFSCQKGKTK